jgi:hypothetical protein
VGSLHGTFLDGQKIPAKSPKKLKSGNILKFGIDIMNGNVMFPPCTVEMSYTFGPTEVAIPSVYHPWLFVAFGLLTGLHRTNKTTIFQVPDESEDEDSSSDGCSIVEPLQELYSRHTQVRSTAHIDLTEDSATDDARSVMPPLDHLSGSIDLTSPPPCGQTLHPSLDREPQVPARTMRVDEHISTPAEIDVGHNGSRSLPDNCAEAEAEELLDEDSDSNPWPDFEMASVQDDQDDEEDEDIRLTDSGASDLSQDLTESDGLSLSDVWGYSTEDDEIEARNGGVFQFSTNEAHG